MDGITLYAIRSEMARYLPLKVQKVQQPAPKELVFSVWTSSLRERLVLSLEGNRPYFGFSSEKKENPPTPPGFCLGLRKRLEGGRLTGIRQHRMDRVLYLDFEGRDDFGNVALFVLVFDLAGRGQNIGLYRDGVLEAAAVPPTGGRFEHGSPYVPPQGERLDLSVPRSQEELEAALLRARGRHGEGRLSAMEALNSSIEGIGKDLAISVLTGAGADPDLPLDGHAAAVAGALIEVSARLVSQRFYPAAYHGPRGQGVFHVLPLRQYEVMETYESVLQGLAAFRRREIAAAGEASFRTYVEALSRKVSKKVESKLQAQSEDYARSQDYVKYKVWAQLLDSSGVRTPPGLTEVTCLDYYRDPPVEVSVPLDPRYSARDNARNYWNKYAKLSRARKVLEESLAKTREELSRIAQAQEIIDRARGSDAAGEGSQAGGWDPAEARESLAKAASALESLARKHGIDVQRPRNRALETRAAPKPPASKQGVPKVEMLEGANGSLYLIGGNARQNDYLVTRLRKPGDVWFHAKNAKGAHVLLRPAQAGAATDEDILMGARLAAERSDARASAKVEVDVVDASRIRKPRGGAPGFVTYTGQKTIVVCLRQLM